MNELVISSPRRVIPRWRDFFTTAALGELGVLRRQASTPAPNADIDLAKTFWIKTKNTYSAGELLASGLMVGDWEAVVEAASFLAESDVPSFTRNIAVQSLLWSKDKVAFSTSVPDSSSPPVFNDRMIGVIRRTLANHPRSAIHWIELALGYTIIGKPEKAHRAVSIALTLSPQDRFVLRCATRFYIHLEQLDTAKSILAKSPRLRGDPWLLAAHLSVAEIMNEPAKYYREARTTFASGSMNPFHLSELGSALATGELKSGNDRRARKLFEQSLKQPTENAAAQAIWAMRRMKIPESVVFLDLPFSYESNALHLVNNEKWDGALTSALAWQNDEPFSTRPAILGSFLASYAEENYSKAEGIARKGLVSNPNHPTLNNNLIYALTCAGKVNEAQNLLTQCPRLVLTIEEKITLTATQGLIHYRAGDAEAGKAMYEAAIKLAAENKLTSYQLRAMIHLAREEVRVNSKDAPKLLQEAVVQAHVSKDPAVKLTIAKLISNLLQENPSIKSTQQTDLSSPSSGVNDTSFAKVDIPDWSKFKLPSR